MQTNKKLTIEHCIQFAQSKNGKCNSLIYLNNETNMLWECEYGHIWKACFGRIKNNNSWCPVCAKNKQRLNIQECIDFANRKSGICLSKEYINCEGELEWQCKQGHIWKAKFTSIKHNKTWCPYCAGVAKGTI